MTVAHFRKAIVLTAAIVAFAGVYYFFGDQLSLQQLATHQQTLRQLESEYGWAIYVGAFLLYVFVSALSIPGGAVALSLLYGSYFGLPRAMMIVSFASTAGATLAMLTSRFLFRDFVQSRFSSQLAGINRNLEREGAFYLFTLRLLVVVPFSMLNLIMGLTNMKWTTYWWVSQLGMLPGTMAYVYAGSTVQVAELAEHGFQGIGWQTLLAFAILGIMPITIKKLLRFVRQDDQPRAPAQQ